MLGLFDAMRQIQMKNGNSTEIERFEQYTGDKFGLNFLLPSS